MQRTATLFGGILFLCLMSSSAAIAEAEWAPAIRDAISFHASFDKSMDADIAKGDGKLYFAESLERKNIQIGLPPAGVKWSSTGGRAGGALQFTTKTSELVFFKGQGNVPETKPGFEGTVSLWLKLTPKKDLPKGFVDPLQITDSKWNDGSFFVDFDQAEARTFRLGVFSEYKFWNPADTSFDDIAVDKRPMVHVPDGKFENSKWTHVAFCWSKFNEDVEAEAKLYIDGKLQGKIPGKQRFDWKADDVVIMLGINYVGGLDELTIFDRPLSAEEIATLCR